MSTSLVAYRQTYSKDDKDRQVVTMTRVVDTGLSCDAHEQLDNFFSQVYDEDLFEVDYDVSNESGHEWEFYGDCLLGLIKYLKDNAGMNIAINEDDDVDIESTLYHVETY